MKIKYCILVMFFFSCNSIDKSKPEAVVKAYEQFGIDHDSKSCYGLISTKSKEIVSYGEFKNVFDREDSAGLKFLGAYNIEEQEKDLKYPTFRRVKFFQTFIDRSDTIKQIVYFTLINENNEWKRVWTITLLIVADEKYNKGDYEGAISICGKAIELNPFDAKAYEQLAWCYGTSDKINNGTIRQETLDKISKSIKYAIALEPDIPSYYNSLARYYLDVNNFGLAMEFLKKGLKLCLNKNDKLLFLSNIGKVYSLQNDFLSAKKYFNDALEIDSNHAFTLYSLGNLYNNQGNYLEAIKYFEKDSAETELPDDIKSDYYYSYAETLHNSNRNAESKVYILKALELSPSNEDYKSLYDLVK